MSSPNAHLVSQPRRTTIFRWPSLKKTPAGISCKPPDAPTKRRKRPSIRLGRKKRRTRGGFFLLRAFRRLRLRWLRLKYSYMLKKLKAFYSSVVKDLIEAGATMEVIQKRIMLDTYFTLPIMPMSVAGVPSHVDRLGLT
ncbi:uncharacterized protein LOC131227681 [Magnolia sinica]|uniref:uncharacterized protein LOC131227681 n=1 Tax=Magnolia sinica TaxID=86752 RepID=UPI00265AD89A|nr:uncharacterized protein LOC131227681 [Magnolia sinica]